MVTKFKRKKLRNNIAEHLFSSKYKPRIIKQKKEKVAMIERKLESSTNLLNNFRGHFSSFI